MPKIIVKDHKYYFKIRGLGGVKGDKGDTGPAGPQGPQGPYVNVVAGTTTTLPAGSSAQVTVNNTGNTSVLNFGVPQGAKGDKGDAGTPGAQGPRGFAATVNVGETTTGQPGTNASVVNAGNEHDAVLKFTIPKGEKGDTGETGPQGPTGGVKSTVVAELPETGESDKYYLVNRTAEGGTITTTDGYAQIENGENAGDLTASQLLGNAEQTTYSGKNLFCIETTRDKRIGGLGFTIDEGVLNINGTTTGSSYYYFDAFRVPNSGAAVLSISVVGAVADWTNAFGVQVSNDGVSNWANVVNTAPPALSTTLTLDSTKYYRCFWYANASGIVYNHVGFKVQMEYGSTPTDWVQYVGGIPAPNPSYPQAIETVTGEQTVQVTGKNLVEDALVGANIDSLGRIVASDGFQMNLAPVIEGRTYTMSIDGNQHNQYVYAFFTSKPVLSSASYDGTRIVVQNNPTFTAPITGYAAFRASNGYTTAQLELGSTATAYEPYHGRMSYEVNLGKNLVDINSLATTYVTVSDGVATGQAQQFYAQFGQNTDGVSFIKQSGQISISLKAYTDGNASTTTTDGLVVGVAYTDGTAQITAIVFQNSQTTPTIKSFTTTAGKDVAKVIITYANAPSNIWHISEFQIEKGGQATTYAPYFTPIELAKIGNYQDRIYKDDGKWYIEKQIEKVVLNGTENWTAGTGGTLRLFYSAQYADVLSSNQRQSFLSNNFHFMASGNETGAGFIYQQRFYFYYGDMSTDANAFKTWLSTHPTTVYYALANPTTTEITDDALLAQLNFLASLYEGENNISLVGTGAQGEFTGNYVVYDKYNKHKVYIWSSDDNTWQIIVQ